MEREGTVTSDGSIQIRRWVRANIRVRAVKNGLRSAEFDRDNAALDLAKFLLPDDPEPGEKFAIWFGDSLIECVAPILNGRAGTVSVRQAGKSITEIS